jgi:glutamate decarboxylase
MNQNVVKVETSNILTLIERQVIGTLHHVFFNESEAFYEDNMQNPKFALHSENNTALPVQEGKL